MNPTHLSSPQAPLNPAAVQLAQARLKLEGQIRNGASWFFWIAGMSVLNTIVSITGSSFNFVIGLGITQVVSGLAFGLIENGGDATIMNALAFSINLAIAAIFLIFGIFARKPRRWAFIAGIALYALDAVLFLIYSDWLSLVFHAIALSGFVGGMTAIGKLKKFDRELAGELASQPATFTQV